MDKKLTVLEGENFKQEGTFQGRVGNFKCQKEVAIPMLVI